MLHSLLSRHRAEHADELLCAIDERVYTPGLCNRLQLCHNLLDVHLHYLLVFGCVTIGCHIGSVRRVSEMAQKHCGRYIFAMPPQFHIPQISQNLEPRECVIAFWA